VIYIPRESRAWQESSLVQTESASRPQQRVECPRAWGIDDASWQAGWGLDFPLETRTIQGIYYKACKKAGIKNAACRQVDLTKFYANGSAPNEASGEHIGNTGAKNEV